MKSVGLLLVLLPWAATAATITVNSTQDNSVAADGRCTLREAIANVNAAAETTGGDCMAGSGSGETITFNLRLPATIRRDRTLGELTLQRDVTITGPANATLRIAGAGKTRIFEIVGGTTQMSGVTIQSGMADHGGGVLVDSGASLNLTNCTLRSNRATVDGGGIYNDGGAVSLTNCKLTGNKASNAAGDGRGGGMYNASGTASLGTCTLSRNRARGRGGDLGYRSGQGYGGGIYNANAGALNLTDCTLNGNWAIGTFGDNFGGGGLYNGGTTILTDSTLSGNRASNYGGALYNAGALNLSDCTLSGNRANVAGGLSSEAGTVALTNCTLSANRSRSTAGGLIINGGTVTLTNCTVSGNHAGGFTGGIFGAGHATFTNTIVANNPSGDGGNCFIASTDSGHNLEDGSTCGFKGTGCATSTGSSLCNINPHLDPAGLKGNGGPTQTIALCTGPGTPGACSVASPAIDAGDDSVTNPPDNLATDQRGLPRFSGTHVDIGAYEVQQRGRWSETPMGDGLRHPWCRDVQSRDAMRPTVCRSGSTPSADLRAVKGARGRAYPARPRLTQALG